MIATNSTSSHRVPRYRWDGGETMIGPGDMMFAAAYTPDSYDQFSDDFSVWVVFYGPQKPAEKR